MADQRPFDRTAPHSDHDLLLVAAFAADDLDGDDLARADELVGACGDCSTLGADLRAIAQATGELPLPRRPRDFFVRPADAERLRPRGLRRLAAAIGGPRVQLARPLAGGLMMLGFAGLLVATQPWLSQFGGASTADQRLEYRASPVPDSEIQGGPDAAYASGAPSATDAALGGVRGSAGQAASLQPAAGAPILTSTGAPDEFKTGREGVAAGPSGLVIGSVALVAIGAFLLLASWLSPGPRRS